MFNKPADAAKAPKKPDLPWRKDVKWICGILSTLLLLIALPLFTLASLTDHDTSVDLSANLFAVVLSPEGLDEASRVDGLRALLAQQNGAAVKPIPGVDIRVSESDIAGMTPRQVRMFMFKQLSEPLWQTGDAGLARAVENPQILTALRAAGMGILPLMNRNIHDRFDGWGRLFLFLGLVFLMLTALGSRGFGYLVSPGIVLIIVSLPGYIMTSALIKNVGALAAKVVAPGGNPTEYLTYIVTSALSPHLQKISGGYAVLLTLGVACLAGAFLGNGVLYVYRLAKPLTARLGLPQAKK